MNRHRRRHPHRWENRVPDESAEPALELPKVVMTIEFDRATGLVTVGGDGWEWGRDEMLCDFLLKKAGRAVEQMANQIAQQAQQPAGIVPDAAERLSALRRLRDGARN